VGKKLQLYIPVAFSPPSDVPKRLQSVGEWVTNWFYMWSFYVAMHM